MWRKHYIRERDGMYHSHRTQPRIKPHARPRHPAPAMPQIVVNKGFAWTEFQLNGANVKYKPVGSLWV